MFSRLCTFRRLSKPPACLFPSTITTRPYQTAITYERESNMPLEALISATPAAEISGTTICFWSLQALYIFGNVPEQYQRTATNLRGVPWSRKDQHVFLSGQTSLEKNGGLPGLLLTLAGVSEQSQNMAREQNEKNKNDRKGKKMVDESPYNIPIHGAENLSHQIASLRPMIMRQKMKVQVHESRSKDFPDRTKRRKPDWEDSFVQVWKVPVERAAPTGSPWKRLAESEGEEGDCTPKKIRSRPASPDIAKFIAEESMFNGSASTATHILTRIQVRDLGRSGRAFHRESPDHPFKPYIHTPGKPGALADDAEIFVARDGWQLGNKELRDTQLDLHHHPLPTTSYSGMSLSYILKCKAQRGAFMPEKAKELGVHKTQIRDLTLGKSVTTEAGDVVTPEMVLRPSVKGLGAIVADIATADLIEPFLEQPEWKDEDLMDGLNVMYWLLGRGLSEHPQLLEFMRARPNVQHIICAPDTSANTVVNHGFDEFTKCMAHVDPDRFPLHKTTAEPELAEPADENIKFGKRDMVHTIMPTFNEGEWPHGKSVQEVKRIPEDGVKLAQKAAALANSPAFIEKIERHEEDIPNRDMEIIPLGTSSSQPTATRNLCGTLLNFPGIGNYLLDAGEGSIGQIRRLYGPEDSSYGQRTAEILRDLKAIVISHVHADHLVGLATCVKAWYDQALRDGRSDSKLAIICMPRIKLMLEELAQTEDIGIHRLLFPATEWGTHTYDSESNQVLRENPELGLKQIKRISIEHCWQSYATELTLSSGFRVAWSGDCRPSDDFADACQDAHLLVHECTFSPEEAHHAKAKKHCTSDEAVMISRRMKARRTLFTHFSSRYSDTTRKFQMARAGKMPWYQELRKGEKRYLQAFDLQVIKLKDWQRAACYTTVGDAVWSMRAGLHDPNVQAMLEERLDIAAGLTDRSPSRSASPTRSQRGSSPRERSRSRSQERRPEEERTFRTFNE